MILLNDGKMLEGVNDFIDWLHENGIDNNDLSELMRDFYTYHGHSEQFEDTFRRIYTDKMFDDMYMNDCVHLVGDDYYIAVEQRMSYQNELREIASALRDRSRKGNTRADLAKAIENVVDNMDTMAIQLTI